MVESSEVSTLVVVQTGLSLSAARFGNADTAYARHVREKYPDQAELRVPRVIWIISTGA
jgi:hypothetical protein